MNESIEAAEKRVSWAELFFDLVFVFAITEVSVLLEHDHSWPGLLRALVAFVPIYWMWVGTAIHTNRSDVSRPTPRLHLFAVALAAVFMAIALPESYGELGPLFAFAYWAGRIILGVGLLRRSRLTAWANPYTVSMVVTGPLLVVGSFLDPDLRLVLWGLAAAIDLATPTILRARMRGMQFDAAHLAERFGLFVLIALGESVVAIGATAQSAGHLTVGVGFAVAAAFGLACGLWWVYFHFAADAIRHALATAAVQLDIARHVLTYGHLSFIASIVLMAMGMRYAVAHPDQQLGWGVTGLLFGGAALYLATFGFTRWVMFRLVSRTRLAAAAAVLLLMPAAPYLPALVALLGLAALVAVLNAVELMSDNVTGWRAQLARRLRN